jgi:hypothetical protein
MKRWQWYTVAVFAGIVALEAAVFAAPAPNNCGVNMLCRVRTLVVSGTANLGGTVTGAWSVQVASTVANNTDYGAFFAASTVTGAKFREVACWSESGSGSGTATIAVRNVTDNSTLCSGTINCALSSPIAVFDCNSAFLASKVYALRITSGCSVTDITTLGCNVEVAH